MTDYKRETNTHLSQVADLTIRYTPVAFATAAAIASGGGSTDSGCWLRATAKPKLTGSSTSISALLNMFPMVTGKKQNREFKLEQSSRLWKAALVWSYTRPDISINLNIHNPTQESF